MRLAVPVVLATGNAGKVREFNRLFAGAFQVARMPEGVALPEETGETFAENARLKAQHVFDALECTRAVLADDSGLEVTALGGAPGIYSARYAGEAATDADNVAKLLDALRTATDRSAQFVCALCLVLPSGGACGPERRVEVEGFSRGTITQEPRGLDGFGYDPVFLPDGWRLTLAEASPEDKDAVSHRGAAARVLLEGIDRLGGE